MKKQTVYKILIITILIALILGGMAVFLNNYLLPVKLNAFLQNALTDALERPVYFEKVGFNILKGVVISDITVFQAEEKKEVFFKAKRVSFNPLLLPLINKKAVITQLAIDGLNIKIERNKEGKLDALEALSSNLKTQNQKKFSVILTDFTLKNSTITLEDYWFEEPQTTVFENVNAHARLSLPSKVKFKFNSRIKDKAKNISLKGAYYFTNQSLNLNLNCLDFNFHKLSPYFEDKFTLPIENDITDIAAGITLDSNKKLTIDGTIYINKVQISMVSLTLYGDLVIRGGVTYDLKNKTLDKAKGFIVLRNNNIRGVLYIDNLENIEGKINFTKEGLFIEELNARTKGISLTCEGYFKNFSYPELKLTIKSDLKLQEAIGQLSPAFREKLKDIEIKGDTVLCLNVDGTLKEFWSLDFAGSVELTDVVIKSIKPPVEIKNIQSKVNFTKDEITIDVSSMEVKNTTYSAMVKMTDFKQPLVNFKLNSDNTFGTGEVKFSQQTAQLENIIGKYKGVDFELSGQVYNLKDPVLNIYAKLSSSIENLKNAVPKFKDKIEKLKLAGKINSSVYFEGKAANPLDGFAKINASSPQVGVEGLKINAVELNAQLKDKKISINKLNGNLYGGQLNFNATNNFTNPKQQRFEANLVLSNINLNKLVTDTKLKDKKIKGTGALNCSVRGFLNNTNSFKGSGWITLKDGNLWEMPILKKLAGFIDIQELEKVVFTDASGNYQIQNSRLTTEDLTLLSENVSMTGKGSLGFNGGLDFLIETQFSEEFYKAMADRGSVAPIFLETLAKYALRIQLTGTLQKPKFTVRPIAIEDILKEELFKGLEKIFK